MNDKELFELFKKKDYIYKAVPNSVLKHLPRTWNGSTLCCYQNGSFKYVTYVKQADGCIIRDRGLCADGHSWESLAKEMKLQYGVHKTEKSKRNEEADH